MLSTFQGRLAIPRRLMAWMLVALVVVLSWQPYAASAFSRSTAAVADVVGVAGWSTGNTFYNVRAAPRLDAAVVATLQRGQQVRLLAAVQGDSFSGSDVWYRLAHGAAMAYVHSSGIQYVTSAVPWSGRALGGAAIYSYSAARPDAVSDGAFAAGSLVTVLGLVHGAALQTANDAWYQVSIGSYRPAYIYSASLVFDHRGVVPAPLPLIGAVAALAVDMDSGRVLFSRNADVPRAPASLAKMMTAAVALDHLAPNDVITVPAGAPSVGAAVGGTAMGLLPGERLSLRDLMYGMLLPSGNDAAYTIADAVAGSQTAFAALMNAKAAALGLAHTHFVQGYGLDSPGQYSTARDMVSLAGYDLQHYALFRAIVDTTDRTIGPGRTHRAYVLHNLDQLLGVYPGAFGVKTGTTPAAGQNLVAAVQRDGHRLIVAVLGATDRYADATALLNYAVARDR